MTKNIANVINTFTLNLLGAHEARISTPRQTLGGETSSTTMQNLLDSSPQAKLGYALMAVGALKATEHLAGLARGAWKHLLRPRRWLKARYGRQDMEPWVLISGKLPYNQPATYL